MKHVQLCLSARKSSESSFYPLWTSCDARASLFKCGKGLESCLIRRADAIKHVQACLRASRDGESSFHHCGCMVKLV